MSLLTRRQRRRAEKAFAEFARHAARTGCRLMAGRPKSRCPWRVVSRVLVGADMAGWDACALGGLCLS